MKGMAQYTKQRKRHFAFCLLFENKKNGLFARIIGKISALTILQYVNFINNWSIGRIKYALN